MLRAAARFFLYRLNIILPKKKTLWLAGAWYGEKYSDNSRYLFEYVLKHEVGIRIFWVTRNKSLYKRLLHGRVPVVYAKSLRACWYVLRARVYLFSSSLQDVSLFGASSKTFCFQLWHGSPLKKICCDDPVEWVYLNSEKYRQHIQTNPFDLERYDAVAVPSIYFQKILQSAFRLQCQYFPVVGYPRVDYLLAGLRPYHSQTPKLLYAPTFRGCQEGVRALGDKALPQSIHLAKLDRLLHAYHACMEIQYHPVDAVSYPIVNFGCIFPVKKQDDFYAYLQNVDILITDYSGLMFDFLLTKKPVICVISDIDSYMVEDRELYRHPSEVPGLYVCNTWDEVHETLENIFKNGPNPEKFLTDEQRSKIYAFQDLLASQRIVEYLKNHINFGK